MDKTRGLYAVRMTCGICNTLGMKALNRLHLYDLSRIPHAATPHTYLSSNTDSINSNGTTVKSCLP
jgi:hypothetical protein